MSEFYHKENPFLIEIHRVVVPVTKKKKLRAVIMDSNTGNLISDDTGYNVVTTKEHVFPGFQDIQEYVKVYKTNISFLRRIGTAGVHVFSWVVEHLNGKQDKIVLEPKLLSKELGYTTDRSVYNGIYDLIREGVIARAFTGKKSAPTYWINPTVFYNGNRQHLIDNK